MNDLTEYLSQQDIIDRLLVENRLLQKNNSKWKRKYEKLKSNKPTIRKSRTSKAELFVRAWIDGDKSLTFKRIAEMCFLSIETIKNISYKLRHQHD